MDTLLHDQVREYYGETLSATTDLKTSACCTEEAVPEHHKPILSLLPDEVLSKFYGCGSPIPPALDGCTVLDLGCGTGRDAFVAAALAGPTGRVIGVDMTEAQLDVATRHRQAVADALGHDAPTTEFRLGTIEDLGALGIADGSVDVVISNCVLNLAPDKGPVFAEIDRVLKVGGELYVSDVFVDRRLSDEVKADPVLVGECLGGALYTEDFRRMMAALGWADVRTVTERPLEVDDAELRDRLGNARFVSRTIRAFKLPDLIEDTCEDYGQVATYRGGVEGQRHAFVLDDHHRFEVGRPMLVCGNSAAMVEDTRYAPFFDVTGDRSTHFGLFDCAPVSAADAPAGSCC
ncbi:methyltransferase domain-containing protein [Rubrivirga sp. IMCC45206]|uniref:methyltransferase domain-containing protein n=1 Tax=Rubrivirga sp. IMCC45206 TaxID=3391614 RepID=UPI00398FE884